jgi:catechol 2,3-dioxygenase-like lactoylglutathione lyase family enzyme
MGAERIVANLYARSVFFVADAERALRFYTEELGFSLDWDSKDGVFQVSLFGFELILNQVGDRTRTRAGHGRLFIGLEDDQGEPLRKHIADNGIQTFRVEWGRPTLVIKDMDANELFFWVPHDDFSNLGKPAIESTEITEPTK